MRACPPASPASSRSRPASVSPTTCQREGVQFWGAQRRGLVAGEFVELGDGYGCLSVARRASGAGIAAGQDSSDALNAVVRDPGDGYWSAPAVVAAASGDDWRHSATARSSPSRTAATR